MAQRFLSVRIEEGLSQQAFADSLGISLRAEQNYERGVRRLPAEVLLALARTYRIDPLWVLDGPDEHARTLAPTGGLDHELLLRAIKVVKTAAAANDGRLDDEEFATWIGAVYRFYLENPSASGAEILVRTLVGGMRR